LSRRFSNRRDAWRYKPFGLFALRKNLIASPVPPIVNLNSCNFARISFSVEFEAIIEYVEKHNASAGLSIFHKQYKEDDDNIDNGAGHDREDA
jgi:hypothetical protein